MSSIEVRPFHRRDREQLATLVNAHAQALVPGMGVSISTVLGQLERQPGEAIVDPWVSERMTLVAEQHNRAMAAAHMLRCYAEERAGTAYRDTGGIEWLLFSSTAQLRPLVSSSLTGSYRRRTWIVSASSGCPTRASRPCSTPSPAGMQLSPHTPSPRPRARSAWPTCPTSGSTLSPS